MRDFLGQMPVTPGGALRLQNAPVSRARLILILVVFLVGGIGYWNFSSLISTAKATDAGNKIASVKATITPINEVVLKLAPADPLVIHHTVLFSCSGWRLNKLPEVKAFIQEAKQYKDLEVRYVGGDPRLVFYSLNGTQIGDEVNVVSYKKDDIHDLMAKKGLPRIQ